MEIRPHTNTAPAPTASADKASSAAIVAAKGEAAPTQTVIAAKQPDAAPSEEQISHALKSINRVLQDRSQGLEFSVDPDSERTIVKVVDKSTHEVIRQMPTAEALEIAKALDRLQSLLVKQQA
jgi:flagellar protein FlaG